MQSIAAVRRLRGVADMAAREMIAAEGSVFGCAYTDEWKAEHRD